MKFIPGHNIFKAATAWKPQHFSLQTHLEMLGAQGVSQQHLIHMEEQ